LASNLRRSKRTIGKRFSDHDTRLSRLEKRRGSNATSVASLGNIEITGGQIAGWSITTDAISYSESLAAVSINSIIGADIGTIEITDNTDTFGAGTLQSYRIAVNKTVANLDIPNPEDPDGNPASTYSTQTYGGFSANEFRYVAPAGTFEPLYSPSYSGYEQEEVLITNDLILVSFDEVDGVRGKSVTIKTGALADFWIEIFDNDGVTTYTTYLRPNRVESGGDVVTNTNYISIPNWPTIVSPTVTLFSGTVFGVYFIGRSSSTVEIKRNIVDIDGDAALSTIAALQPRSFNYKYPEGVDDIGRRMSDEYTAYGFIAEEIAEVNRNLAAFDAPDSEWWSNKDPETMTYEDFSEFKPVDWDQRAVTALTVKGVQELIKRVEALEARLGE